MGLALGLLLGVVCPALLLGQGYSLIPEDALVIPIGEPGTPYESMDVGQNGGTLYLDRTAEPRTWNPHAAQDTGTTWFTERTHRGLVRLDPMTGALVPDLARAWEVSESGLVITVRLRRGVRWSDGTPITADDVLFTYNEVVLNPAVGSVFRDAQQLPDGKMPICEKVDDHTVTFTLSTPFRPALNALGFPLLPQHVLSHAVRGVPPDGAAAFRRIWDLDVDPTVIVVSGPWQVNEVVPGGHVVLVRNPFYYAFDPAGTQLPYYDAMVCTFVQTSDAAVLRFRSLETDVVTVRVQDLAVLELEGPVLGFSVRVTHEPGPGSTWFLVNQDIGLAQGTHEEKRALYRTIEFRQALAHSVDKKRIIREVYGGLAFAQWSPVPAPSPFYAGREVYGGPITEARAVRFPYDPSRAMDLLDELGVVDQNGDGFRQLPSGAALTMELMSSDDPARMASCLVLVEDWQAIGLNARLRVVDLHVLIERLRAGTGDMIYLSLPCPDDPHGTAHLYRSCGSLHAFRYSACQDPHEVDRRVDELLDLGASTFDLEQAFTYYAEYQQLVAEQLGFIFTVVPTVQYAVYNHVGNAIMSVSNASSGGINGLLTEICFDRRM